MIHNNRQRIQDLRYYQGTPNKFRLMHYRGKWQLQREMRNEGWRYVTTREFFREYFKGMILAFRHNADIARKIKTECKKEKKALQRKQAKIKREEEKEKKRQIKLMQQD